jgi:ferrochelatase
MNAPDAVLFIGFGGPEKREDVMPFLETVTRGRGIPPERLKEVAHHYEVMGGSSPINTITNRQAEALGKLAAQPVYVGNRNWHPFLEDTLRKMATDGIKNAVGFVTAAHRCEASWERYLKAVDEARKRIGGSAPVIDYVEPWFDHSLFIEAICEQIKSVIPRGRQRGIHGSPTEALGDDTMKWIFTAHSIPIPMAQSSHYVQELQRTAELVAEKFGQKSWTLAYTSRSGAPTDPWLEPDVCDEIRTQANQGVREILAVPIGFVADHVEVLFDLDVEAKEAAQKAGVTFHRAQTVGDHPLFIQMIADVIQQRRLAERRSA